MVLHIEFSGTGFSLSVFAVPEEIQIQQAKQVAENGICGPQGLKPLMNPMRLRRG
jgi:hypothetical protein